MSGYICLIILLSASPFATCAANAMFTRVLRAAGSLTKPPQFVALITVAVGNAAIIWLAWLCGFKKLNAGTVDLLCGIGYVLLTYNALAFCYFNVLNASETSLHVHILMTLLVEGSLHSDELARRYGADEMVKARVERMVAFGQLRESEGYFFLGKRAHLLLVGRLINLWRRALRLPLTPM